MNTNTTDHDLKVDLVVTVTWEESSDHCCADDPYQMRRPIKATYGSSGFEGEYHFGMEPDNLIEELIVKAVEEGEIQ